MQLKFKVRKEVHTFNIDGFYTWRNEDLWCFKYGPAVIWADGSQGYYLNGKRHREDGPAYIGSNGHQEYWFNSQFFSKEDWEKKVNAT